jgi:hypothetical protein
LSLIRFIVYDRAGNLKIVERPVSSQEKRFDVCQFFDQCPYADLDGVICIEENDEIRSSVCPEYKMRLRSLGTS